ncbi:MAG TPA: hypothetical protein PKE06_08860 [Flavilitoribacter sp.]|nr:hypothetical protein [Flavilitoribacter sp.]HMQ90969.1 hypothetical protein [Flavilitoribacter sp.]
MKTIKAFQKTLKTVLALCLALMCMSGFAQTLDYENRIGLVLDDGTQVVLYGRAQTLNSNFTGDYYYLPVGLTLSKKEDGKTPEFLFMKYTTDETAALGGVQGALLHFLMEWGLSPAQEKDAQAKLTAKIKDLAKGNRKYAAVTNPKILGPVDVKPDGDNSFRIISGTLDKSPTLVTSGVAPMLPGLKAAVAAKMDKNDAQLLAATFEKTRSISDIDVQLFFTYNVLYPAVDGQITVNWTKIQTEYEKFHAQGYMIPDAPKGDDKDEYIQDSVVHTLYNSLVETKAIDIRLDDKLGNEVTAKITELFFNVFINSIASLSHDNEAPVDASQKALNTEDMMKRYQNAERWKIDVQKLKSHYARKTEVYRLNYRLNVPQKMYLLGNLAEWYDGVRHNKACVGSVNLNDPFYQHREINMILDIEAENMFGQEVNYVTVNVRKRRNSGNPFTDQVTIDRDYLKNKGLKATVSYARGEDKNSDVYEYKTQWSLKGGRLFPEDPDYVQGDWEGLTLAPPVTPRTIQFEADLDQLKEMGIRRATLQVRYKKFGEEMETNIPITVSQGIPLVEQMIFTDRDTRGYVSRLVLTHENSGKLALDWDAKINDDYVFAMVPDELRDKTSELFKKAIDMGKTVISTNESKVEKADSILDKFKDVIDIVRN